ncbi:MAG: D-mannonate epimerase [Spirochaetes bacterium GWF1_41_5]|nr:MAG: D-mannonate epimerase [Spirochaetes bacterium GWF1_41_5]HBE02066.1 D-mannonate epimerase [Spirochaetia bacterium]
MLYFAKGSPDTELSADEIKQGLFTAFEKIGKKKKVLALPPDFTRFHSRAGELTGYAYEYYKQTLTDILPALGTHYAMTEHEINKMFGNIPLNLFRVHDWRSDVVTLGDVPADYVKQVSGGACDFSWPAQVNKLLLNGGYDLIFSPGQVVPHEVVGMANYNKNIFVGTGGREGINKSHFVGAAYGMERIMGRADTPVRSLYNYASEHFASRLPVLYAQTVLSKNSKGALVCRGLFIGCDSECFYQAAELSLKVNFTMLDEPLAKAVVFLDPEEFKSTWLGNKAIYRTRMAIADRGELIILAPGVKEFGEDKEIDRLIRAYGYRGTPLTLEAVKKQAELSGNLSAAAHLIHGSSEGRFKITYCPGRLTRQEIENAGFDWEDLKKMSELYNPDKLKDGFNIINGEKIFFISNPALGLWSTKSRFGSKEQK